MNKKAKINRIVWIIVILGIVGVLIGGYYLYSTGKAPITQGPTSSDMVTIKVLKSDGSIKTLALGTFRPLAIVAGEEGVVGYGFTVTVTAGSDTDFNAFEILSSGTNPILYNAARNGAVTPRFVGSVLAGGSYTFDTTTGTCDSNEISQTGCWIDANNPANQGTITFNVNVKGEYTYAAQVCGGQACPTQTDPTPIQLIISPDPTGAFTVNIVQA